MPRDQKLVIVSPLKEQDPLDHRDALSGKRIALHWEGIGPRLGSHRAWVSLLRMDPGNVTTLHVHPQNDEFFVVVEGTGCVREEDAGQIVEHPLDRYDILLAPQGVAKQIVNTGEETMTLVQVYAPSPPASTLEEVLENHETAVHLDGRS